MRPVRTRTGAPLREILNLPTFFPPYFIPPKLNLVVRSRSTEGKTQDSPDSANRRPFRATAPVRADGNSGRGGCAFQASGFAEPGRWASPRGSNLQRLRTLWQSCLSGGNRSTGCRNIPNCLRETTDRGCRSHPDLLQPGNTLTNVTSS